MADSTDTTSLSKVVDPATAEIQAFARSFLKLNCRQREVLMDLIRQIISLEAEDEHVAVACLLEDAPELLRLSSQTN